MKYCRTLILFLIILIAAKSTFPCTNLLVTRGASTDGSAFLVYTNDGEWLYRLSNKPAADHMPGDSVTINGGRIHQVTHTYAVIGFQMNEHQVAIGETTFTGREELWNHDKFLKYWHLMSLALERSGTAREAVEVITSIVDQYGYGSEGESFSIVDPNEAWILEMVGTGTGGEGAIWVAVKIPDGYISAHANMARIGTFPLDDPENCIYSDNVISFAVENEFYDPESGEPFRFNEAYNPTSPDRLKYCESRVWSIFRRAAPSLELSADYHRGVQNTEGYPLWIEPDDKLSLKDVMALVRDHYEGTPFDMTKGVDAGPFGNPNRWRPLFWDEGDSTRCSWERPVSTYNTAFSYIGQVRDWLPDEVGGICWFGVDDTYFTCYVPVYVGVTSIPEPFTIGDINKYDPASMWWVFNFVSNFANLKYSYMIKDVQKVQSRLEDQMISEQDSITKLTISLAEEERSGMLTSYSQRCGAMVHQEWQELGNLLVTRYNDGYVKDEENHIREAGYPSEWMEEMNRIHPDKYRIPDWNKENRQKELPH